MGNDGGAKMMRWKTLGAGALMLMLPLAVAAQDNPAADMSKTANPELVGQLAKELDATPEQAAGAAGALFNVAKDKLSADDWSKVAAAVPGMDGLMKAAPAATAGTSGVAGAMGKTAGGMATAASAFSSLGLKPDMVSKAVPILTDYVSKSGGTEVGQLLAGALK
jgi:Protein of unknown function VcgC/VcgE (DUF2780)